MGARATLNGKMDPRDDHDPCLSRFRAQLDAAMSKAGRSGRELERRAGYATGTVSKLRRGKLKLKRQYVETLAQALDVDPRRLVADTRFARLLEDRAQGRRAELIEREIERLEEKQRRARRLVAVTAVTGRRSRIGERILALTRLRLD